MKIILLGAPGAGKGSQAVKIIEHYGLTHISTGDAFRMNIANNTEIGKLAKTYIDKGLLVPDEVTVKIVEERLKQEDCKKGFMLDGFPRSIPQAEALSKITDIDVVINIEVDREIILKRLAGRRNCSVCGANYHISTFDKDDCAKCGGKIVTRDDDKEEAIKVRLNVYEKTTAPLVEFYSKLGKLKSVDGNKTIDGTFEEIKAII